MKDTCFLEMFMISAILTNFSLRSFSTIFFYFFDLFSNSGSFWLSWACRVFGPCTSTYKLYGEDAPNVTFNSFLTLVSGKPLISIKSNLSFLHLLENGNYDFDKIPMESHTLEFDKILITKSDRMSLDANKKIKKKNDFLL